MNLRNDLDLLHELHNTISSALASAQDSDACRRLLIAALAAPTPAASERNGDAPHFSMRAHPRSIPSNTYRQRRVALNLTQRQLAERTGVPETTIVSLEHGNSIVPDALSRIEEALSSAPGHTGRLAAAATRPARRIRPTGAYIRTDEMRAKQRAHMKRYLKRLAASPALRDFAETLRSLRERAGLTQAQLSTRITGKTRSGLIARVENQTTCPSAAAVERMADIFGIPVSTFPSLDSVRGQHRSTESAI